MSRRSLAVLAVCIALAMGLVACMGPDYRNETHAFLRALLRAL